MILLKTLICGVLLAAGTHANAASPWSQLAQADLDFVYKAIRANHPGAIDDQNSYFRDWMERGYAQSTADAAKVQSLGDVQVLLRRYFAGFADGHLSLSFNFQQRHVVWPGLLVLRQGQRYRVVRSEESSVPPGAELLSCDGRSASALLDSDILPAAFNNTQLDWVKTEFAARILVTDSEIPHAEYARCSFIANGKPVELKLSWRKLPRNEFYQLLDQAKPKLGKDSTITELKPGYFWVRLPQFQPDEAQAAQIKQLTARMPSLRGAKLVIFDIRGNQGGDNVWGQRVLDALFGAAYMRQRNHDDGYALWRASEGNLAFIRDTVVPKLKRLYSEDDPQVAAWSALQRSLELARSKGEPFARQSEASSTAPAAASAPVAPLSQARVALVTESGCASSCLDFADAALSLPGAVHLGETTGADTVYMDVRRLELPSGLGSFVLAQKVYRGRLRAHNAAYVPQRPYDGNIRDTAALQAWSLQELTGSP